MAELLGLFRVGPSHSWEAWRGDTVRAVGDGTSPEERAGVDCEQPGFAEWAATWKDGEGAPTAPPPDNSLEAPCRQHARHLKVAGPWSGVIPVDGPIPLDDRAAELLARLHE